jgi:integrase
MEMSSSRRCGQGSRQQNVKWRKVVGEIGAPGLHFHDLRHTGNTFAAQTGTSLRDLMARMGHDNPRAALIYQHATSGADRAVAAALDEALRAHQGEKLGDRGSDDDGDEGAAGVLVRVD